MIHIEGGVISTILTAQMPDGLRLTPYGRSQYKQGRVSLQVSQFFWAVVVSQKLKLKQCT